MAGVNPEEGRELLEAPMMAGGLPMVGRKREAGLGASVGIVPARVEAMFDPTTEDSREDFEHF